MSLSKMLGQLKNIMKGMPKGTYNRISARSVRVNWNESAINKHSYFAGSTHHVLKSYGRISRSGKFSSKIKK